MLKPYDDSFLHPCVELYLDVFTNEPFNYGWMTKDQMTQYFLDIQNTPRFSGVVALEDGRLSGFCVGIISDYFGGRSYEIKEIMIARALQGKGRGGKMLAEIEEYLAGELGVEVITLMTDKNINAYPFYLKNGFGVSESAVYMSKALSPRKP